MAGPLADKTIKEQRTEEQTTDQCLGHRKARHPDNYVEGNCIGSLQHGLAWNYDDGLPNAQQS